jgi:hypothetical protein
MNDTDRLELLDRIADRVPELDLGQNAIEWTTLEDGHEALLVNGDAPGRCVLRKLTATTCMWSDRWRRWSRATSAAS